MHTKAKAQAFAKSKGCELEAVYTGVAGGWLLSLTAPEGKLFQHSGCSIDCDISGNGNLEVDWWKVIVDIDQATILGFEEEVVTC